MNTFYDIYRTVLYYNFKTMKIDYIRKTILSKVFIKYVKLLLKLKKS